ncbi:hypothetical protein D3C80_1650380 [compost metagenome]
MVEDFAVIQRAQGIAQVVRQALLQLLVGVAFDRRLGLDLVGQAMVNAGKDRREHQVRVGIGAGYTVLKAHIVAAVGGHAYGHGAVVQAPARRIGHVELRTEAAVGVDVGAKESHRSRHGFQHATNGVAQRIALQRIVTGEDVLAGFLVQQ